MLVVKDLGIGYIVFVVIILNLYFISLLIILFIKYFFWCFGWVSLFGECNLVKVWLGVFR